MWESPTFLGDGSRVRSTIARDSPAILAVPLKVGHAAQVVPTTRLIHSTRPTWEDPWSSLPGDCQGKRGWCRQQRNQRTGRVEAEAGKRDCRDDRGGQGRAQEINEVGCRWCRAREQGRAKSDPHCGAGCQRSDQQGGYHRAWRYLRRHAREQRQECRNHEAKPQRAPEMKPCRVGSRTLTRRRGRRRPLPASRGEAKIPDARKLSIPPNIQTARCSMSARRRRTLSRRRGRRRPLLMGERRGSRRCGLSADTLRGVPLGTRPRGKGQACHVGGQERA